MPDQSHLDAKYFIDPARYNCPFCNRRHVTYSITAAQEFDWTDTKKCVAILVKCGSCGHLSMHLSFQKILVHDHTGRHFASDIDIDDALFFSVPSSFHVVDERIPRILRELLAEAEGCLKSNFLTGASACARKLIYELASKCGAEGAEYEERIKSLKSKLPAVDGTYFDTLLTIQQVTSSKVHESAYDGWESRHLRLILATLREILYEVFVTPAVREEKRRAILAVKDELLGSKSSPPESLG
jgi:hypothetical protein